MTYTGGAHRRRKGERASLSEADYAELIASAHGTLGTSAPVTLIWDNLNTHRSAVMRHLTSAHPDWLTVVQARIRGNATQSR